MRDQHIAREWNEFPVFRAIVNYYLLSTFVIVDSISCQKKLFVTSLKDVVAWHNFPWEGARILASARCDSKISRGPRFPSPLSSALFAFLVGDRAVDAMAFRWDNRWKRERGRRKKSFESTIEANRGWRRSPRRVASKKPTGTEEKSVFSSCSPPFLPPVTDVAPFLRFFFDGSRPDPPPIWKRRPSGRSWEENREREISRGDAWVHEMTRRTMILTRWKSEEQLFPLQLSQGGRTIVETKNIHRRLYYNVKMFNKF